MPDRDLAFLKDRGFARPRSFRYGDQKAASGSDVVQTASIARQLQCKQDSFRPPRSWTRRARN